MASDFDDRGAAELFGIDGGRRRARADFGCRRPEQRDPLADEIARRELNVRAGLRLHIGAHAAAHGVAHDDDMGDLQHLHRIFERRRCAMALPVGLVGRNQIGDIAQDEDFARVGVKDHLRRDARIAAADEQNFRALAAVGEFAIAILLAPEAAAQKDLVALNQASRQKPAPVPAADLVHCVLPAERYEVFVAASAELRADRQAEPFVALQKSCGTLAQFWSGSQRDAKPQRR